MYPPLALNLSHRGEQCQCLSPIHLLTLLRAHFLQSYFQFIFNLTDAAELTVSSMQRKSFRKQQ